MTKITIEETFKAVVRYLKGLEGQQTIANSFGVQKSVLQTWI